MAIRSYFMQIANAQQLSTRLKASAIKNKYLMIGALYTIRDALQWWLRWISCLLWVELGSNNIITDLQRLCLAISCWQVMPLANPVIWVTGISYSLVEWFYSVYTMLGEQQGAGNNWNANSAFWINLAYIYYSKNGEKV